MIRNVQIRKMKRNYRLKPNIFNTRYWVLRQLRDATLLDIKRISAGRENLILADFGCGEMPYKPLIQPFVGRYAGIDLEMNPLAEYIIDFDSKTNLENDFSDIVLSNQVLEHVDSPQGYLAEAFRILKPGGHLILSTHGYWLYHPTPFDYWRWTSAGLKKEIEKSGFQIESFFGILGLAASGLQLFQDGICLKLPKFLTYPLALVMQSLIFLFNLINSQEQRNRDGAVYILVARKPI